MTNDLAIRLALAACGVLLLLSYAVTAARARGCKLIPPGIPNDADLHFVLDLAARLSAKGNAKGVELCQQLLDTMLHGKDPTA